LTNFSPDEDNDAMARPDLSALSDEAGKLLNLAEQYREKIKSLPPDDPTRRELESVILNLLDRADSLSRTVRSGLAKS
jgi:hypothetical protein